MDLTLVGSGRSPPQEGLLKTTSAVGFRSQPKPEAIAAFVRSKAPGVVRIGLETGLTATWLWTELKQLGLPVLCIDARHARAVLKMQINKSDRNDAAGIARIMQTGWFKEVRVKDLNSAPYFRFPALPQPQELIDYLGVVRTISE